MFEPVSRDYLDQPDSFEKKVLELWSGESLFDAILEARAGADAFVFYEGPPTANGRPGIHHVLSRTLKDAVCRYHTMRGKRLLRKAGWDTHGLPVELEVEKQLGISGKPQIEEMGIGKFNEACQNSVFTYKEEWQELSKRIGYLLDYDQPYVTFHKPYIESIWFLLSRFAANDLLYRGFKVLPWCGRCGTGLSSHEVGQGYADIDDPSVWISFPLIDAPGPLAGAALVAWTTTPWTLPSNLAAAVHAEMEYAVVTTEAGRYVLLEAKAPEVFGEDAFEVVGHVKGADIAGLSYEPLFDVSGMTEISPGDKRHIVVADDFVSAEEGTGAVHLAPYGADDFRVAQAEGISVQLAVGEEARFLVPVGEVEAGTFFKDADKALMKDLKARGRLVKREQYRHSYPHCWRCDTPLLYFPAPAWFIRTTAFKDQMIEENSKIYWSPPEIGSGRFGEWLENNIDWALSRDRFWGTPLPVWVCNADDAHWHCISSFSELGERAGGLADDFDPHRPGVDAIDFACDRNGCSGTMKRVPQVIDCWFDSGSMPYAQYHWPFENRELVAEQFPADFICEGLDQTRGWFYTLHAISTFITRVDESLWSTDFDGAPLPRLRAGGAYKTIMVNGLLLDEQGQKMSKRLGNRVDPWEAAEKHGMDAVRWSLLAGGAAHLSKRYSDQGIAEARRRILGTLCSSYDFFALYARTESWNAADQRPAVAERPAIDRWILSRVQHAAEQCADAWERLEPNLALRALEGFVIDELSNWYIRRGRRRFWGATGADDQAAAFATLHEVLHAAVRMIAPVTPFLADAIWRNLTGNSSSVHLEAFPLEGVRDTDLEAAMAPILAAASLGRAARERVGIRVRQPLGRLLVHVTNEAALAVSPRDYEAALQEELNVKTIEWIDGVPDFLEVKAKPNYPRLGKRAGKDMKALAAAIAKLDRSLLFELQSGGTTTVQVEDRSYELDGEDVQLETVSVEGLEAETDGYVTIGLDTQITPELECEGLAREVVNRIQGLRKDTGLEVSDRIKVQVSGSDNVRDAVQTHREWIVREVLADGGFEWVDTAGALADASDYDLPCDGSLRVQLARAATPVT